MINIEDIKKDFDYIKNKENGDFYSKLWTSTNENQKFELYFPAKENEIEQKQIDNFELFIQNEQKIITEIDMFIEKKLIENADKNLEKILNGRLEFDIVTVLNSGEEYDIELICSKNYKAFLMKKTLNYVVAIKRGKILEILEIK